MKRHVVLLVAAIVFLVVLRVPVQFPNAKLKYSSGDLREGNIARVMYGEQEHSRIGVKISIPAHEYPCFNVSEMEGRTIPYEKIGCGDQVIKSGHKIPNLIHYVWFGVFRMNLIQYYAIRSAALIQKPKLIILHMDHAEPVGRYWERLKQEVPCIRIEYYRAPDEIMGKKVRLVEHQSDVARLDILLNYGGIYSDVNVLFVRPMDELMAHSVVLGKEEDRSYGNSLIMAERNATFIQVWQKSYINFDHTHWSDHSTVMPLKLHMWFPEIPLHVEKYTMMRPNYMDGPEWLTHKNWDLRYSYCVHLYVNEPNVKKTLEPILKMSESDLVTLDNTFGLLVRISLFGTPFFKVDVWDKKLLDAHSPVECFDEAYSNNIPNVVHYVWNGERIQYQHYLGIRSAILNLRPKTVYFHMLSRSDPFYQPYLMILREIKCLRLIDQSHLMKLEPKETTAKSTDKLKPSLRILNTYGGILLGLNTTLLKPCEDLCSYDFAIGEEGNEFDFDFIVAKRGSLIVQQWINLLAQGMEARDALESILRNTYEYFTVERDSTFVPTSNWLNQSNPDLPRTRAVSFRKSGWDLVGVDRQEKEILQDYTLLGILTRSILFG